MNREYMGVPLTRNNRLNILRRAREILSDKTRWMAGALRSEPSDEPSRFCLLGALEQAVYDLRLRDDPDKGFGYGNFDAYQFGRAIGFTAYTEGKVGRAPDALNDSRGYEDALAALDGYIEEVRG